MARVDKNPLTEGTVGAFGKQIVYKKINGKTFMSKYPDMTQVKYNSNQKEYQNLFAAAVEYAKSVMSDRDRTAAYRKKIHANKNLRGTGVYHAAIKAFMNKHSTKVSVAKVEKTLQKFLDKYKLTDRHQKAIKHLISQGKLTNTIYQHLNKVSKATATRDLQDLQKQGVIVDQSNGAGANYSLIPVGDTDEMDDAEEEIFLI